MLALLEKVRSFTDSKFQYNQKTTCYPSEQHPPGSGKTYSGDCSGSIDSIFTQTFAELQKSCLDQNSAVESPASATTPAPQPATLGPACPYEGKAAGLGGTQLMKNCWDDPELVGCQDFKTNYLRRQPESCASPQTPNNRRPCFPARAGAICFFREEKRGHAFILLDPSNCIGFDVSVDHTERGFSAYKAPEETDASQLIRIQGCEPSQDGSSKAAKIWAFNASMNDSWSRGTPLTGCFENHLIAAELDAAELDAAEKANATPPNLDPAPCKQAASAVPQVPTLPLTPVSSTGGSSS
jgi:hypothetical protein